MARPSSDWNARARFDAPRLVDGIRTCRWLPCSKPLSNRQVKWCSAECGGLAFATWDWSAARAAVYRRDQGRCAHCGLDCVHLQKLLFWIEFSSGHNWHKRTIDFRDAKIELGLPTNYNAGDNVWEADHIVALVEGGALCDLANLRTLCHWCHKVETKALAARRARARKATAGFLALVLGDR
jgi:5-methylcytosine-specific restriction endonuclease McrA